MSIKDWIQTVCAVLAVALTVFNLDAERRHRLEVWLRKVSSSLLTCLIYLIVFTFIFVYGQEIVAFLQSQEPIQRYEVVNLMLNMLGICALVWAGIFLFRNLGKDARKKP